MTLSLVVHIRQKHAFWENFCTGNRSQNFCTSISCVQLEQATSVVLCLLRETSTTSTIWDLLTFKTDGTPKAFVDMEIKLIQL